MSKRKLEVWLDDCRVGTLAETANHRYAFAYSESWLTGGFAISPFSLPLKQSVFVPAGMSFDGLWGVFSDSLPDAWGRLLVDRMLQESGLSPKDVTPLDRLAIVGSSGMGALTYRPAEEYPREAVLGDLDELSARCTAVLNHQEDRDPDELFRLGGSSGGARPKVMTDEWIIKFPASADIKDSGVMEKEYMDTASACGITVPETRLLPSGRCSGYFSVKRFDRIDGNRVHMLTAAAILETDWRNTAMDYRTLMRLTTVLSRGNDADLEQMYRRMCFNVFAHNRDDHAKNFSWSYDSTNECWHPSPAYDLTWSTTYYGEHTTTVNGNGRDPGMEDLLSVGRDAGMQDGLCRRIADEIREKTAGLEKKWRMK